MCNTCSIFHALAAGAAVAVFGCVCVFLWVLFAPGCYGPPSAPSNVDLLKSRKEGFTWCVAELPDHIGWAVKPQSDRCWGKLSISIPFFVRAIDITGSSGSYPVKCVVSSEKMNGACSAIVKNCAIEIIETKSYMSCLVYWFGFGWNMSIGFDFCGATNKLICDFKIGTPPAECFP